MTALCLHQFTQTRIALLLIVLIRHSIHHYLFEIIHHCVNDIGIPLSFDDIESATRIGGSEEGKIRPRPVKLVLYDQNVRDQIFHFKSRLRHTNLFRAIMVHKEERKDLRIRIAKLRQAAEKAELMTQGRL